MTTTEPLYKGRRFRRQLDAKWAVFFDALGLSWRYETEPIDLGGEPYRPDFYLPKWDTYLEVQPDLPTADFGDGFVSVFGDFGTGRVGHTPTGRFMLAADALLATDGQTGAARNRLWMLCGAPGHPSLAYADGRWKLRSGAVAVAVNFLPDGRGGREPVFSVDAFAYTGGGTTLDLWPLYAEGSVPVRRRSQPVELTSAVLPGGKMIRIYHGDGVLYGAKPLADAYRASQLARFDYDAEA